MPAPPPTLIKWQFDHCLQSDWIELGSPAGLQVPGYLCLVQEHSEPREPRAWHRGGIRENLLSDYMKVSSQAMAGGEANTEVAGIAASALSAQWE